MDIKAYIESGILEAYVLGSLTPGEVREVQANIAQYPEIAAEVRAIEDAMVDFARAGAVEPPLGLQEKIWDAIKPPVVEESGKAMRGDSKVIPLQPDYRRQVQWRYAAMIALLIGSIVLNIILWNQGASVSDEKNKLAYDMARLQTEEKIMASQLEEYQRAKSMMADTGMQTIVMHTTQQGHPMAATVYWSKTKGEAYVAMNALPMPPKGMQYQLWVIQGGKPVSMGMLPNHMANSPAMQKVDMSVTSGEAFAISLEKEGGNPTPTTVYVLGKA